MSNASAALYWINTEIDQALKLVRERIAGFLAGSEDPSALRGCCEQLHQVGGALRMVGLAGATRFCEAIEGSFSGLRGGEAGKAAIGLIDRAVLALREFVDDLARGNANVPLRLFAVYRDLAALNGKTEASEKDLFFPDLSADAPAHPNPRSVPADELAAYLQTQRSRFQRGLLGWLRKRPGGLEEMKQAIEAVQQIAAQLPEPRALWWVARGLLELFGDSMEVDWLARAKILCNKIDFQLRDLAAGSTKSNEPLLRELLYAIATCRASAGPRVTQIRQLYQLDSLFPAPQTDAHADVNLDRLEPTLNELRSRLDALKGVWLRYIAGEPDSVPRFRELVAACRAKAGELGSRPLAKLIDAIALVATRLPDPYPQRKQFMVIEMASAFLLVESVVQTFADPPQDVDQQIEIMGGWLLDAVKGKSSGRPPAGLRADLSQQITALQLRAHVAKEIITNLQGIEQVLDAFARDPSKRDTLPALEPYLRQVNGALVVLGFERAAEVLVICETMVAALAATDHPQEADDMDWIAEGLSSLGIFLEPCLRGREPIAEAIDKFFRRYERRQPSFSPDTTVIMRRAAISAAASRPPQPSVKLPPAASVEPPAQRRPAVEKPAPARPVANEELLAIYLEEAAEVLSSIDRSVPACRQAPENRDALTTIRRGFHTLKGSGRMVGLMDLGEVAWEIEQVMNRWLEQQRPATPELLELISLASAAFADWIARLGAGSLGGEIDAERIVALAHRLKTGEKPAPAVAAPVIAEERAALEAPAEQIEPEEVAAPKEAAVAGTPPARSLIEIYLEEANQHIAALQREFRVWRSMPGEPASHAFMRAAHTLASSSYTGGFRQIGELAGALEQWTPFAHLATEPRDIQAVEEAIAKLGEMVAAVSLGEPAPAAEDAVAMLQELISRLKAMHPPAEARAAPALQLAPEPQPAVELQPVPELLESGFVEAASGRDLRRMQDDIDEQLLPIFLEEAQTLLPQIGSDLRDWRANPADERITQSLRRGLHTLKGSARMAGAIRLGELTHIMESRVEAAIEAAEFPAQLFADLEEKMDRVSLDVDRMGAGVPAETPPAPVEVAAAPAPVLQPQPQPQPAEAPPVPAVAAAAPAKAEPPLPSLAAMLRINAETLDQLINESGEVSIARSRVEAELRGVKQALADLNESTARLRAQLREVEVQADSQMQSRMSVMEERKGEFDPLEFDRYTRLQELTRMMAESLHDVSSIQQQLLENLGETDSALLHQARISREVQQQLMRMRAVPFSNLNERLYRVVRQTARELDKKAELEIEGAQVELDRGVLDRIGAPLEHMLRNAIGHGLESPAVRIAAGKPETGRIGIILRQESNEIALIVSDDGAGLDLEGVRRKAVEKGLLQPGQRPSEAELAQLIFVTGISTAESLTELSGRGVGMDIVKSQISSMGGRIDIASTRGKGTTFAIYLPLTLAVTQAVMVRGGFTVIAISSAMVEQVLRLKADALANLYDKRLVEVQDRSYPLHYLHHLLGSSGAIDVQPYNSVLLLRSGIQRVALHVDQLIGNEEIVVKNIGPQLARVPGASGATVLADGSIVLIVNPVALLQRARGVALTAAVEVAAALPPPPAMRESARASQIVMVVDDSLTVRKITSRLLEREGYSVLTAKDGIDALEQMKDMLPAVLLVDIEMPRMDGFDLTRSVRADSRTAAIPIIIISSRTADKHRNQAAQLGVNAFLGKPYQEAELLQHVATYIRS